MVFRKLQQLKTIKNLNLRALDKLNNHFHLAKAFQAVVKRDANEPLFHIDNNHSTT